MKEAVGHASIATTMAYTHLVPNDLKKLVEEDDNLEALRELAR